MVFSKKKKRLGNTEFILFANCLTSVALKLSTDWLTEWVVGWKYGWTKRLKTFIENNIFVFFRSCRRNFVFLLHFFCKYKYLFDPKIYIFCFLLNDCAYISDIQREWESIISRVCIYVIVYACIVIECFWDLRVDNVRRRRRKQCFETIRAMMMMMMNSSAFYPPPSSFSCTFFLGTILFLCFWICESCYSVFTLNM